MLDLENKHILITGSSDGLGRLLALELSKRKANIILHGRHEDKVKGVLSELSNNGKQSHSYIICDLNKPETVKESFNKIEKLDVLVNNAGVWLEGDTIEATHEKIIELVNVNLASYLLVFRTVLPKLLESDYAQLLNVVSTAGYEVPSDYSHTIYSATKYGLQGFSEGTAKEFEGKNLRVMGFYPGGMDTKLFTKAGETYKEGEDWMFDPLESVEAIVFMLTRSKKVNVKRLDLINQLFI